MAEIQVSQSLSLEDSQTQAQTQTSPPEASQTSVADAASVPTDKVKKAKAMVKAPPNADRPPGKSLLPTARVQKIMKADKVRWLVVEFGQSDVGFVGTTEL